MKKIKLTQGKYAIVDDEDYHYLSRFKWRIWNGSELQPNKTIYASRSLKTRKILDDGTREERVIFMSEEIVPTLQSRITTHKNGNTLDNRKCNLIYLTRSQIDHRTPKKQNCSVIYKGVWFNKKRNKFGAQINYKKKRYYLGEYETSKEAGIAYNKKAKELYGEYAYQNKIE